MVAVAALDDVLSVGDRHRLADIADSLGLAGEDGAVSVGQNERMFGRQRDARQMLSELDNGQGAAQDANERTIGREHRLTETDPRLTTFPPDGVITDGQTPRLDRAAKIETVATVCGGRQPMAVADDTTGSVC